jgi:phosphoglycolate phosphatase-like HAD superfamily hydrolase
MDISRVRALCFDVDGTLRNTDDQYVQLIAGLLGPTRLFFPQQDVHSAARKIVMASEDLGTLLYGLPDRLGVDGLVTRISDYLHGLNKGNNPESLFLIEGVREMLIHLNQQYPMAVVTARSHGLTHSFLNQSEMSDFFPHVATAQTCRHTKPYPDPILWAAKKMGVSPADCLMIGDTAADIQSGKAAGAQTAGVLCGFGEQEELEAAGADIILKNTTDLLELLSGDEILDQDFLD